MAQKTPPAINVRNFDHITIVVSDLDATEHFYVNVLGLKKAARPAFGFEGNWYKIGHVHLHVILANEASGLPGPGQRNVKRTSRGRHMAFNVDNFKETIGLLEQHEIKVADGPKKRPDGVSQVYIYDPDGHLVELAALGTQCMAG